MLSLKDRDLNHQPLALPGVIDHSTVFQSIKTFSDFEFE